MTRKPTTVYLDPQVARAVKVKAAMNDRSLSDLVNESLSQYLSRDAADLEIINKRMRQKSKAIPYEQVLAEMKRDGLL